MVTMAEVPVSKAVLQWARKYRGLDPEAAAEKLGIGIERFDELEAGDKLPSVTLFKKMARQYRLPEATLARRTPPTHLPPAPTDYRTFEGAPPKLGFDALVAISEERGFQRNVAEVAEATGEARPALLAYSLDGDPWELGERERRRVNVSVDEQLEWATPRDAFARWRAKIEAAGVNVYIETFDLNDCRGFSLYDEGESPAIVVNRNDKVDGARIFTLAHEYAHILIRRPGISDLNDRSPIEAFCNKFAAGFLMPTEALRVVLPVWPNEPVDWNDNQIRRAARGLKVSQRALALRLEQAGVAPVGFYDGFIERQGEFEPQPIPGAGGGNYVLTQMNTLGSGYMGTVMAALDSGAISVVNAAELLRLAPRHFDKVRERIEVLPVSGG